MSKSSYVRALQKQLYLDGDLDSINLKKDLVFKKNKTGVVATVDYERVVPLFYNINLMVDFDNTVEHKF